MFLGGCFFAVGYLPEDLPKYWSILSAFLAQQSGGKSICETALKTAVENLRYLSEEPLATDNQLAKEIHSLSFPSESKNTLGIVLISHSDTCKKCGGTLLVRSDRPSKITVYTETYGTVLGTHYRKFCSNFRKGCSFSQHYGYSTDGNHSAHHYDLNWSSNHYFHRKNSIQIRANGITVEFCRREEVRQLNGMVVGRTRMCPALKPLLIELRNSYADGAR